MINLSAVQIFDSQYDDREDDDGLTVALQTHAARQLVEPLLLLLVGPLLAER